MKYKIVEQVGSVYRIGNGVLESAPLSKDNTFDSEDFGEVAEEIVGDETLTEPYYSCTTFGELYERLRWEFKQ